MHAGEYAKASHPNVIDIGEPVESEEYPDSRWRGTHGLITREGGS